MPGPESGQHKGPAIVPIIFKRYPDLRRDVPWIDLGISPAPLHRLTSLGHGSIWAKRDDLISTVYGGNKVRRLEFLLAEAAQKGKDHIVTMGGIGSNYALATAIYCRRLGMGCTLLLHHQPVTDLVRKNLLLYHAHGAGMVLSGSYGRLAADYLLLQRLRRRHALFIYQGGSSPLGCLGAVNAAFELAQQVQDGLMPEPDYLFYPTASNGGLAGITLGLTLAGMRTRVMGVRVGSARYGPFPLNTRGTVLSLMKRTFRLMKRHSSLVPDLKLEAPIILNRYAGRGYGHPTVEGLRALEIFSTGENIILEPVYTAKACAALLNFIKDRGNRDSTLLYWHTYNSVDLSDAADSVDFRDLPVEFHKFFNTRD